MAKSGADSAKRSRKAVDTHNPPTGGHPENWEAADKAIKNNDLTTGHSQKGDGGDANSKQKNP